MSSRTTITVARQLGSGASYIGQIIAAQLGIKYIDREVLHLAAQSFGLEVEDLAHREERCLSRWRKMFDVFSLGSPDGPYAPPPLRPITDKQLFEKETEIMKTLAEQEDCVIIGRACGSVLNCHNRMVKLLFHAPTDFRVRRVMEVYNVASESEAWEMVEDSDRMRKRFVAEMAGHDWLCAENYHLSLDTSLMPLAEVAELALSFVKRKIGVEVASGA